MSLESILTLLQGLLTPTIGCAVVYVAYQQLQTNRDKLKLDKYERRAKVYAALNRFLGSIAVHADVKPEELATFDRDTAEADFLFGSEDNIRHYLKQVRSVAIQLWSANAQYRDHARTTARI